MCRFVNDVSNATNTTTLVKVDTEPTVHETESEEIVADLPDIDREAVVKAANQEKRAFRPGMSKSFLREFVRRNPPLQKCREN